MSRTISFTDDTDTQHSFTLKSGIIPKVACTSDTEEHSIETTSPSYDTTTEFVGGRPKNPRD